MTRYEVTRCDGCGRESEVAGSPMSGWGETRKRTRLGLLVSHFCSVSCQKSYDEEHKELLAAVGTS